MLIQRANQHQTTVLIVDEAQNLDWDVLEEIRLLGNLETRRGKMLQIILSGQPELDTQTGTAGVSPVEAANRFAMPSAALHRRSKRRSTSRRGWRARG